VATVTPAGIVTGCLPTRDMLLLHETEDFAADPLGAALAVGQDALVGRDDRDAEPAAHARQLFDAAIPPAAGAAEPAQRRDDLFPLGTVTKVDVDEALRPLRVHLVVLDVAFALQHVEDADLQLAARHRATRRSDGERVPDPGEQVGDGIGHHGATCGTGLRASPARRTPARRSWPWSRT